MTGEEYKSCRHCQRVFRPLRPDQLYCSYRCKQKAKQERRKVRYHTIPACRERMKAQSLAYYHWKPKKAGNA